MKGEDLVPMVPWWQGFRGEIKKVGDHKYDATGIAKKVDETTIEVTELPIHKWTSSFKGELENMISEKGDGVVKVRFDSSSVCADCTDSALVFLGLQRARHGPHHTISPSSVPSRANIAALKSLGARAILAFSAVGSLREDIPPGSFVLPTQIIDRTKGIRPSSFFDGTTVVAHAAFGDPFSMKLVRWLESRVRMALKSEGRGVSLLTDKCKVCMERPQFSTRVESIVYRSWGMGR
jgi:purine nucleoside phosphorylase